MSFKRIYVWAGHSGAGFSDFHNWTPVFSDQQPPSDDDLVIFNSGAALSVDGQNGLVAEIDVVLGTTLTIMNGLEATGTISGVALNADSGGAVIVGSGAELIGIGAVDVIGFTGAGTVIVTAGGHMDDNGMVLGDRATGSGAATIDGAGSLLVVANNLPGQPNGILIVGNAGTGALAVQNGASLGSPFATLGEQAGAIGTTTLDAAAWSAGQLTIGKAGSGHVSVLDHGVLTTVSLVIGGGGTLDVAGSPGNPGTLTTSTLTMTGGTLDVALGGIVAIGADTGPVGVVSVAAGHAFTGLGTLRGNVVLQSQGILQASGAALGALAVSGDIAGTGTAEPLTTLDLGGAVAAGVAIAFAAPSLLQPGVLVLRDAADEGGTIGGFAQGNTIEIPGLFFTHAVFTEGALGNPGTLVLSGGTETPLSFAVVGGYAPDDFVAVSDTLGTEVTLAPCFVAGTTIATAGGACPVERLELGMRVRAHFAGTAPVTWIGHRFVDCRRHPAPHDVWPVCVRAHAFGAGRPHRDVWLSPDHAVFVGGVLIPVRYLVNDATIVQQRRDEVTYWHVELARHDVILAEGLPCESFLDTGNRGAFANGGAVAHAQPDFARRVWAAKSGAPLVCAGAQLAAARQQLVRRAGLLGYAMTDDPGLKIVAEGRELAAERDGRRWRVRLPETTRSVRLLSRVWRPIHGQPAEDDTRLLGVAVASMWLDRRVVSLESPGLASGWHPPEPGWRWTNGDAGITVDGVRELAFEVAMTGTYWRGKEPPEILAA